MTASRRLSATTWGFGALLLLLGGYVYLVEVRGGERSERARAAAEHFLPFPPEAATEVILERPEARVVCRREAGAWRIVAPVRSAADDFTLERLLKDASEAKVDRPLPASPADLARYGLAPHPVRLAVAAGSQRVAVRIGKDTPTGDTVYAQRETPGAPVLLAGRQLRSVAEKTLYDLREKRVLAIRPEDLASITFTNRGRRVRLIHEPAKAGEPHDRWFLVEPRRALADRGRIERSLNLLDYVRAEEFVSETPERLERYGLAPPWGSARFDLKDGHFETVLLGTKHEVGAVTRTFAHHPGPGPVFTINDNLPDDAQRPPEEWRERHAADFERADVAELRLITPARTVVCAKKDTGDDWTLAEFAGAVAEGMNLGAAARLPNALHANRDRVDELVSHLATLEAKTFLEGARPSEPRVGLAKPSLKVVALDKAGKTLASVSFGAAQGEQRFATSSHLDGVYLVPAPDAARFRATSRDLQSHS
jgi:hypothetical protein